MSLDKHFWCEGTVFVNLLVEGRLGGGSDADGVRQVLAVRPLCRTTGRASEF